MNRHFLLSALFLVSSFLGFGQGYQVQSKYFVYLQTEPAQPFYIKINGQRISANASGYLILPQLKDGDYKLTVGFQDNKTPEQRFDFKVDSKDKGYLIKDYGVDGWGLFDLQTMSVQKSKKGNDDEVVAKAPTPQKVSEPTPESKTETVPAENVSDFTKVLSQAANDPSLLEKPKPQPVEEKLPEVVKSQPVKESQVEVSEQKPVETFSANQNASSSEAKVVRLVYDDRNEMGQVDPVTIFIPEPSSGSKQKKSTPEKPSTSVKSKQVEAAPKIEEPKENSANFVVEEKPAIPQGGEAGADMVKSNNDACKVVATNDDFLKLRRSMASQSNDDDMIAQASKAFKAKCYTTDQIKYLSSMFLSNAGKYNFYEAAYPFTSDQGNFASLESEINEGPYRERFKKLIQ